MPIYLLHVILKKTIMKTVFVIITMLLFVSVNSFSQSEKRPIPLYKDGDNRTIENNETIRRNIDIPILLPTVIHDIDNKELIMNSPYISLEDIPYYVIDSTSSIVQSGFLFLQKGIEKHITISALSCGDYTIAIEIDGMLYSGYFQVEY